MFGQILRCDKCNQYTPDRCKCDDVSASDSNELLCGDNKLPLSHDDLIITFHKLWTECVGTKGYDKKAWKSVRQQICDNVCNI